MTSSPLPPTPAPQPISRLARLTGPIAGLCLSAFMFLGLITTVYRVAAGELDLMPTTPTWPAFLDGRVTKEIADSLANAPVPSESARVERAMSWLVIGDLGPRVRPGCTDWLFLSDEFKPHARSDANLVARAREVAQVKARLDKQKTALLVVMVPDKSRVQSDQLCNLYRPASLDTRLTTWRDQLGAAGVHVLDLTPTLAAVSARADAQSKESTMAFLRTDTHWTQLGARAAAQAVAQQIRSLGIVARPEQAFDAHEDKVTARPGDLVRLAGIDTLPVSRQPRIDLERPFRFEQRSSKDAATGGTPPATAPTAEDLFGDSNAPNIALIGTSFSRTSNFVPFLQADLDTRIVNAAMDGGDFAGAARQYFQSPAFRETPPALVIWEIPERVLQMPSANESIAFK